MTCFLKIFQFKEVTKKTCKIFWNKTQLKSRILKVMGMTAHSSIPAVWEAEAVGFQVWPQPGQLRDLVRLCLKMVRVEGARDTAQCHQKGGG